MGESRVEITWTNVGTSGSARELSGSEIFEIVVCELLALAAVPIYRVPLS